VRVVAFETLSVSLKGAMFMFGVHGFLDFLLMTQSAEVPLRVSLQVVLIFARMGAVAVCTTLGRGFVNEGRLHILLFIRMAVVTGFVN